MPRTKTGVTRRQHHKAVLARTKGFRMTKNRLYKVAHEADMHAGQYAFAGRKRRKRDIRALWITRISAAVKIVNEKLNYSRFIMGLKEKNILIDRKILSDLAVTDSNAFKEVVKKATA